jgi:predicted Zn-dependent peptidase
MAESKRDHRRLTSGILRCGTRVVVYRLKGARTTSVLLRIPWDRAFESAAPEAIQAHSSLCGHLLEHAAGRLVRPHEAQGMEYQGLWTGRSADWRAEGAPGDLGRMLRLLAQPLHRRAAISPGILASEWSRVQLEAHHPPKRDSVRIVQELLDERTSPAEERYGLEVAADEDASAALLRALPAVAKAWLRPERSLLVIAGPHNAACALRAVERAFEAFPDREPEEEPVEAVRQLPPPKAIRHTYDGKDPVPAVYAWVVPYLAAYRGAMSLIRTVAHYELMERVSETGVAYWAAVGPAAHHVWGAVWCSPSRVDEAVDLIRRAFLTALERLEDPDILAVVRRNEARTEFMNHSAFPQAVTRSYVWLRRMFPEAEDPFSTHLRQVARVTPEEIRRIREEYGTEGLVTTVEYRPAG